MFYLNRFFHVKDQPFSTREDVLLRGSEVGLHGDT